MVTTPPRTNASAGVMDSGSSSVPVRATLAPIAASSSAPSCMGRLRRRLEPSSVLGFVAMHAAAIRNRAGVPPSRPSSAPPPGKRPPTPCTTSVSAPAQRMRAPSVRRPCVSASTSSDRSAFSMVLSPSASAASNSHRCVRLFDPGGCRSPTTGPIALGTTSGAFPPCCIQAPSAVAERNTATTSSTGITNRRLSPSKSTGTPLRGLNKMRSYCLIG